MKNFEKVLAASGGTEILAVIEGLPVSANGFFLTEDQLTAIEASLITGESASADAARLTAELATANQNLITSNEQLATSAARITELEAMDGTASNTEKGKDDFESPDNVDPMAFDFQKEILKRLNA